MRSLSACSREQLVAVRLPARLEQLGEAGVAVNLAAAAAREEQAEHAGGRPPARRESEQLAQDGELVALRLIQGPIGRLPCGHVGEGEGKGELWCAALHEGCDLHHLRTHARGDGPFVGDAFGHVEEAAAPFACRLTRLLPALRPQHSIDAMLAEQGLDRLRAWLDAVTVRPSCTSTMPTTDEMVESSRKMMERIKAMAAAAA